MKKKILLTTLCIIIAAVSAAAFEFDEIDALIENNKWEEARKQLSDPGLSHVGVLLRRAFITIQEASRDFDAEQADKQEKRRVREVYSQALELVNKAFVVKNAQNDPEAYKLYYARAFGKTMIAGIDKSIGFLKQIDDIFEDFEEAITRKPDYIEAVVFAGEMYRHLPGRPISIGNKHKAISFLRYARTILDDPDNGFSQKKQKGYSMSVDFSLCILLEDRNWNIKKRLKKQKKIREEYNEAESFFDKLGFYEAKVDMGREDDREEARRLLASVEAWFADKNNLADISEIQMEQMQKELDKVREKLS